MASAPDDTSATAEAAVDFGTAGAVRKREGCNLDGADGDMLNEVVRS